MGSIDIEKLISQVKTNCEISDAKFWGSYSICGLLLRLREQFRKETGVMPWQEIAKDDIGEWIAAREELWRQRERDEFVPLSLHGTACPPFEVERANALLGEEGIVYGAGVGLGLKPSFFLARLVSQGEIEGFIVYVAGDEFVRDLSFHPAMLLNNTIFVRRDALTLTLWEKFEEIRQKRSCGALAYAFSLYGISPEDRASEGLYGKIREIGERETEPYIYHEIGEALEGKSLGQAWKEILAQCRNRRVEFFLRGLKDVLADTSEGGMLRYVIENDRRASLAFYLAFLGGFRKSIFTEIQEAFAGFMETEDWSRIEIARKRGYRRAAHFAERVLSLHASPRDKAKLEEVIERELIAAIERPR
jgi:Family of unknown function (DUF6866) N-terminal domain/Family of unknown function (DUF6866) C-terminal domain